MNRSWCVYLISNGTRTYVGSTTDPARRLRQHNRELTGGARSTMAGAPNWKMIVYVAGFPDRSSACRWERIVKCRVRGLDRRREALEQLVQGVCPEGKGQTYIPVEGLILIY